LVAIFATFNDSMTFACDIQTNVVVILCDDLGIGDVQCFNSKLGKIRTPSIDRIASQGMRFVDAHSASSVCTPTRYGLLTGRYAWRTKLQSGVVQGFQPCLISPKRSTLQDVLRANGFHTAIIGKWHLNMRFLDPEDGVTELNGRDFKFTPPVGARSPDGPIDRGFDYFYGIHHARSAKAMIEQDQVIRHDNVVNLLPALEQKSIEYIKRRSRDSKPFFLYVPLSSPHTPIVPTQKWKGASGLGDYADFVLQTDDVIGNIVDCLDAEGLGENTLLIVTSDNGCSRQAKISQLKKAGHDVSAGFRGSKADIWEGGHRVPFVLRWPSKVTPNTECDQTICLNDIFATVAECVGFDTPANSCQDSVSFAAALSGKKIESTRNGIVHHSISGHFAYRHKDWKLILARGSGGWSSPTEEQVSDSSHRAQLYQLTADPSEITNLIAVRPKVYENILKFLEHDVERGRSTDGPDSKNDIEKIEIWK
jgi:arylsulfatase A-like enzyme